MSRAHQLVDREAERAYLAEVIASPALLDTLRVSPDELGEGRYAAILQAAQDVREAGEEVNLVSLRRWLLESRKLAVAGGDEGLLELHNSATHTSPREAMQRIRELHHARAVREALLRALGLAEAGNASAAMAVVQNLSDRAGAESRRSVVTAHEAAVAAIEHMGAMNDRDTSQLVPTGLGVLDGIVGGLEPGDLLTIGAQTNVGKSWVALTGARAQAHAGHRTGIISLEDPAHLWGARLVAIESGVSTAKMRQRRLTPDDFVSIGKGVELVRGKGIDIAIATGATCPEVVDLMRTMVRDRRSRCIWIDYAQALPLTGGHSAHDAQRANVTAIKAAAARLGVPVVLLAQIKRGENPDREPTKYDLKEGGDLEIKSEMVVMMWRDVTQMLHMKLDKSKVGGVGTRWAYAQQDCGRLEMVG
jgi:replicative DNA helicase